MPKQMTREDEIALLTRAQRRDDRDHQEAEVIGYHRVGHVDRYEGSLSQLADPEQDPAFIYERDHETDQSDSPVEAAVASLAPELQEVYYAIYGEGKSQREAATDLGVDRQVVRTRLVKIHQAIASAVGAAYGA